jgi:hypothetical protein
MTLTPEERITSEVIAPEEVLESERGSLITGLVIARAWRDSRYLDRLLADPGEVLTAAGMQLPPGVAIRVFQDTPAVRHVALTSLTSEPEEMLPLLRELVPLPEGSEVRLIQNTEQALCLVVPLAPAEPETLTDVEVLRKLAPRASVFAGGDVIQSMAEAFAESEAALVGEAAVSAEASVFSSGDVVQSAAEVFAVSEAALVGAAEVSAASSAQSSSSATAAAAAAAASSVSTNTVSITNTYTVAEAQVDAVAQAAVAVVGAEAEAVATTTTAAAEAEAVAVAVIVLT